MPLEARRSLHLFRRLTLAMFLLLVTGPTPLLLGFCRGFISDFISLTKSLVPPTPELSYYQWLVDSKIRRFRSTWFKNSKYSIVFSSFFHIKVKYLWKKILITILSICICPSIFVSMIAYNWQNETIPMKQSSRSKQVSFEYVFVQSHGNQKQHIHLSLTWMILWNLKSTQVKNIRKWLT